MIEIGILVVGSLVTLFLIVILFFTQKRIYAAQKMIADAREQLNLVKQTVDIERKESFGKLKDELHRKRKEFELELKRDRLELDKLQARLSTQHEVMDKREQTLESLKKDLQQKERNLSRLEDSLRTHEERFKTLYNELIVKLEMISSMSKEDARAALIETMENEVYLSSQKWIQKIEEEARQTAKEKAVRILATAMQRYAADYVSSYSSGVVHLPNEEMKGRIIGKEGRNIKSLEMATGMEFIIEDTPDIKISCA